MVCCIFAAVLLVAIRSFLRKLCPPLARRWRKDETPFAPQRSVRRPARRTSALPDLLTPWRN